MTVKWRRLGWVAASALVALAWPAASQASSLNDYASDANSYWGAAAPNGYGDVVSNSPTDTSSAFEIKWANVTLSSNVLTVGIYTNYLSGTLSTQYGDLFLTPQGNYNPAGGANHHETDNLLNTGTTWKYAAVLSNDQIAVGGGNTSANVYSVPNNLSITQSHASGGFRTGQPVEFNPGNAAAVSTGTFSAASTGTGDPASANGLYLLTFTIDNFSALNLGNTFAISWAMTCANDVIQGLVTVPGGGEGEVPIPAALPLFASAVAGFGAFGRWRRRKDAAVAA